MKKILLVTAALLSFTAAASEFVCVKLDTHKKNSDRIYRVKIDSTGNASLAYGNTNQKGERFVVSAKAQKNTIVFISLIDLSNSTVASSKTYVPKGLEAELTMRIKDIDVKRYISVSCKII